MLDLRELIGESVKVLPFAEERSLASEDAKEFSDDLLSGVLSASGRVENHAGCLTLEGELALDGEFRCARCCRSFRRVFRFPMSYRLAETLAGEDTEEFLLLEDGCLDLSEVVRGQLLLELPSRFLCPACGCDRNVTQCSCDLREQDPRWNVLQNFFDEED